MHVVVTGGAGFIGSHVCEQLVALGHRVTAVDSFDSLLYAASAKRRNAADIVARCGSQLEVVEHDVVDLAAMTDVFKRGCDVVCHLAALAGVRPSLEAAPRYMRVNVEGTTVVLEAMRRCGLQRLVFASSSSVYGARSDAPGGFREDDPCPAPASPYAASKLMAEIALRTYSRLYGIGSIALRYFTVYGPRQRPDMGIAKFVAAIAAGKPITLYGDGTSLRDYTYIDDIVRGTVAAIESSAAVRTEIVNLGGTRTTSLAELIALIEATIGRAAIIQREPDQPGDVPLTFANIERAAALFGYAPQTPPAEGIKRYWDWVAERPMP